MVGLFLDHVRRTPDQIALVDGATTLTYAALDDVSGRFADRLRAARVRAGDVVATLVARSARAVVVQLALAKLGAVVAPLGLGDPEERTSHLLADADAVLLVSDQGADAPVHCMYVSDADLVHAPDLTPSPVAPADGPAPLFLLYTSGTTGTPKGATNTVRGMVNQVLWTESAFAIGPGDRVLYKAPATFDVAMWELWSTLGTGATLVVLPEGDHRDADALLEHVVRHDVTVCHVVPTILRQVLDVAGTARLGSLRLVLCGGEAMPAGLPAAFHARTDAELVNVYGPTEASVQVTWWPVDRGADAVLIGRPIDNCTAAVLSPALEPVPWGDVGELAIGGAPLAIGYHRRDDLTAAAFRDVPGLGRMYLTGDLARTTDGGIEYLGRRDDQVKVAGNRIELDGIAHLARQVPGVRDAAVVAMRDGDDVHLVCVVTGTRETVLDDVRRRLCAAVPAAHRPQDYLLIQTLPETASGKLDRRALERWVRSRSTTPSRPAPAPASVDHVWTAVLGAAAGDGRTFLEAGGSSITAMRMSVQLRQVCGVVVRATEILQRNPTAEQLTSLVASDGRAPVATARQAGTRPLMSDEQRQLWTHLSATDGDPAYSVVRRLEVDGALDPARLGAAWRQAVGELDVLRTTFRLERGEVIAEIHADAEAPFDVVDLDTGVDWEAKVDEIAHERGWVRYRPGRLPRGRLVLVRDRAADRSAIILSLDHLVSDQRSCELVLETLSEAYAGTARSRARTATAALVSWESDDDERRRADLEHLLPLLRAVPPDARLSFERMRTQPGSAGFSVVESFAEGFRARLSASAVARAVSPTMLVLSAFARVVADWTGNQDVVVGVPVSVRDTAAAADDAVGYFMRTVPVAMHVSPGAGAADLAPAVRDRFLDAVDHSSVSYGDLQLALGRTPRDPLLRFWFNDVSHQTGPGAFAGRPVRDRPLPPRWSLFDVGLYVVALGEEVGLQLSVSDGLWERATAVEFLRQVASELARAVVPPPASLPAPPPAPVAPLRSSVFADRAREHATARPDAVALVRAGRMVTWRELVRDLDTVRERLVHELGPAGPGPVVVLAERSAALVSLLLAAWEDGRTVALLDPAQPEARLAAALTELDGAAVVRVRDGEQGADLRIERAQSTPSVPGDAVTDGGGYVLATSGTTGVPTLVHHDAEALATALSWYVENLGLSADDRFVMSSPLAHDPVLREVLAPVLLGATLVIPDASTVASPADLLHVLRRDRATVLHVTPARARLVAAAAGLNELADVRLVALHGEAADHDTLAAVRALAADARIVSVYGLTETSQVTAWGEWDGVVPEGRGVPLRHVAPFRAVTVATPRGDAAPGVHGEVVVQGHGVAGPGGRLATGDLARTTLDGGIEILGRTDHRLSVFGHRVEAEGVESVLRAAPGVGDVVVVQRTAGGPLSAAVVCRDGAGPDAVARHAAAHLPEWERPTQVVRLPAVPLSANGKVDRSAVVERLRSALAGGPARPDDGKAPGRPAVVDAVVSELRAVLGTKADGRVVHGSSPFDTVGATSFDILVLADALEARHGWRVSAFQLFQCRDAESLAAVIAGPADVPRTSAAERVAVTASAERDLRRAARRRGGDDA